MSVSIFLRLQHFVLTFVRTSEPITACSCCCWWFNRTEIINVHVELFLSDMSTDVYENLVKVNKYNEQVPIW